jgi:hypothetical protein
MALGVSVQIALNSRIQMSNIGTLDQILNKQTILSLYVYILRFRRTQYFIQVMGMHLIQAENARFGLL